MKTPLALLGAVLLAPLIATAPARGEPQACFDAALQGQKLEREGRLLAAREAFVACGQTECPDAVARQCALWLASAKDATPSVLLEARDERGRDRADVTVTVDDETRPRPLDGRDLELDPGGHVFHWRRGDGVTLATRAVLKEHEKSRPMVVTFPDAAVRRPVAAYVLGGITLASLGVFVGFGIDGVVQRKSLHCDVNCTPSQGAEVRRDFVTADVALGVAVLAGAGTLWYLLARRRNGAPPHEGARLDGVVLRF